MEKYVLTSKIKSNPYQPIINFEKEKLDQVKELVNNKEYLIILKKVDEDYFVVVGEDVFQVVEALGIKETKAIVVESVDISIMDYIKIDKLSSIEAIF